MGVDETLNTTGRDDLIRLLRKALQVSGAVTDIVGVRGKGNQQVRPELDEPLSERREIAARSDDVLSVSIMETLQKMPETRRAILLSSNLDSMPHSEIAHVYGMSVAQVKSEYHRGMQELRAACDAALRNAPPETEIQISTMSQIIDYYIDRRNSVKVLGTLAVAAAVWGIISLALNLPDSVYFAGLGAAILICPVLLAFLSLKRGQHKVKQHL